MELSSTGAAAAPALSPSEIFRGRKLLILGSTGFVGKVLLSMLLDRYPQIGRAYVMVRRGSGTDSEARFWQSVVTSPAFDPLRDKHGGQEALAAFLREKVSVVDGDITEPNLGMSEELADRVAKDIDVLINSSGRVTFNPPLESALRTNVEGTKNVIAFAKRMKPPGADPHQHLLRRRQPLGRGVGGRRAGRLLPAPQGACRGRSSRSSRRSPTARCGAERIRQLADDAQVLAQLRQQARDRLREENRDPDDEQALKLAVARERKEWIRSEATKQGVERGREVGLAQHLHVHEEHGRPAGGARDRHRALHRAPGHRRERGRVSVPRLERGLHHLGAAGLPGAQGAERAAGLAQADPRRRARRPRRARAC